MNMRSIVATLVVVELALPAVARTDAVFSCRALPVRIARGR